MSHITRSSHGMKGWEWPALAEVVAMVVVALVVLGAMGGMVLKVLRPAARARKLANAVHAALDVPEGVAAVQEQGMQDASV